MMALALPLRAALVLAALLSAASAAGSAGIADSVWIGPLSGKGTSVRIPKVAGAEDGAPPVLRTHRLHDDVRCTFAGGAWTLQGLHFGPVGGDLGSLSPAKVILTAEGPSLPDWLAAWYARDTGYAPGVDGVLLAGLLKSNRAGTILRGRIDIEFTGEDAAGVYWGRLKLRLKAERAPDG